MDQHKRNLYQAFLERHRNSLPREDREATMSLITANAKLMASGENSSPDGDEELIAQSEEIARKRFHLRPVPEFKSLAEVYQKLVLVNDNYGDTRRMFNNLRGDPLILNVFEDDEKTVATVTVGRFTLARVEEGPITGLTRKKWLMQRNRIMSLVKKQFMSSMEEHCYRLYEKDKPDAIVESKYTKGRQITRYQDEPDELNLKYYRRLLARFKKNDCGIDLVFYDKLTKTDRIMLMEAVQDFKLRGRFDPASKKLIVFSWRPAVEVVHDIIHRKHPDLCGMYDVEPPRARRTDQTSEPSDCGSVDQLLLCGSLNYALSEAASIVEGYEPLSHVEAMWIALKFL